MRHVGSNLGNWIKNVKIHYSAIKPEQLREYFKLISSLDIVCK